ncbi:ABC transporter substrate-binding protein [Microlunatus sp. Y2014]|uniref:ABC transporter substrate-binding protein n=1 Tax=Microlunatus sp. Y2014 TaxID=3418488 RepID=UPI003DA6F2A8
MLDSTRGNLTRRALLGTGLAAGAGLALAACQTGGSEGTGGSGGGGGAGSGEFTYPAHVPYDGPEPELAPDPTSGVPAGYQTFPDPAPSTGRVPLELSAPVEFLVQGIAPAVPRDRNEWWRLWEKNLGTEMKVSAVDSTAYTQKFQTAVAGDLLGDLSQIPPSLPQLPALLEKMFVDLTPYLSGDAVTKYPNLANMAPTAWQMGVIDQRLWGIPQPRIAAGSVLMTQGDIFEAKGIDVDPQLNSGEDFLDLCREVTDRDRGVFAIGQVPQNWTVPAIMEALEGPHGWYEENGTYISAYASPEYLQALEIVKKMWDEGLIHPNSYSDLGSTAVWFDGGITAMFAQNFASLQGRKSSAKFNVGGVVMPKWEGGGAAPKHLGVPAYGATVGLKKTDDENRIDELLRVLDYIASPFGTQEFLAVNYGVEGRQWTIADNQLVVDKDAPKEVISGPSYAGAQSARDIYVPNQPEATKQLHDYCSQVIPTGVVNPGTGVYSETNVTDGANEMSKLNDLMGAIIQGREQLSAWEPAVAAWREKVGNKIGEEIWAEVNG